MRAIDIARRSSWATLCTGCCWCRWGGAPRTTATTTRPNGWTWAAPCWRVSSGSCSARSSRTSEPTSRRAAVRVLPVEPLLRLRCSLLSREPVHDRPQHAQQRCATANHAISKLQRFCMTVLSWASAESGRPRQGGERASSGEQRHHHARPAVLGGHRQLGPAGHRRHARWRLTGGSKVAADAFLCAVHLSALILACMLMAGRLLASCPMLNTTTGVQVLNRLAYASTLSHLRRINSPIGREGKARQAAPAAQHPVGHHLPR